MENLTEQQINEELVRLEEAAFLLPLLALAARTAAPHILKAVSKQAIKKTAKSAAKTTAKGAGKGVKGATKFAAKHPGKTAVGTYVATHPEEVKQAVKATGKFAKTVKEAKEKLQQMADFIGKYLDEDTLDTIAKVVVKYGLPIAAVMAILYGGKKLYDYMTREEEGSDLQLEESPFITRPSFKEYLFESDFDKLKKNKVPLDDKEREQCFKDKAVWNDSVHGKIPSVWKSINKNGKVTYVTNTHRAYNTSPTLKGAIGRFHKFIRRTA